MSLPRTARLRHVRFAGVRSPEDAPASDAPGSLSRTIPPVRSRTPTLSRGSSRGAGLDPRVSRAHLIAVTGWRHEDDRQRALESGFDAHVTKPADPEPIVELVARSIPASDDVQPT